MASREQNEAVAGLLKQTLARNAGSKGACLEPEILAAYFEHSLGADEAKACEVHLSRCAECREQLGAMVRAEEAPGAHGAQTEPRREWLTDWRWLTAAAAVILIIAVWTARRPQEIARVNEPANKPLVAMKNAEPASANPAESSRSELRRIEPNSPATSKNEELGTAGKTKAPLAKVPSPPAAPIGGVVAGVPQSRAERKESQSADLAAPMNRAPNAPVFSDALSAERDLKRMAPSAGLSAIGRRAFVMPQAQQQQNQIQQNKASQSITLAQARPAERQRVAAGTPAPAVSSTGPAPAPDVSSTTSGGATGIGSATGAAVGAGAGGGVGARADTNATLEAETRNEKKSESLPMAKTRLTKETAVELQAVEARSSGKIIDTPVPNVKWRFDTAGFVERSVDNGATWNGQEVDAEGGLLAGSAPSEKVCWIVGRGGGVYVTKDAVNWVKVKPPEPVDLVDVSAKDASSAVVTAADGRKFSTHDRGKKWNLQAGTQNSNPH